MKGECHRVQSSLKDVRWEEGRESDDLHNLGECNHWFDREEWRRENDFIEAPCRLHTADGWRNPHL